MTAAAVLEAAARLEQASLSGRSCAPIVDLIGGNDIDLAYQVQQTVTGRRLAGGARLIGRKIGLTSTAVQTQIGVDRPDFGVLFDNMRFFDGEIIPYRRLMQPRAQAEVAFVLRRDLTDATDPDTVREAIALAYPALEVVDSRIANWQISITDTVADNASAGVFAIGSIGRRLDEIEPIDARMTMRRNGEVVSRGDGRGCLGDPFNALAWLAAAAIESGSPLLAGDVILSGALGPMVAVAPGDVFQAMIESLGTVTARFSQQDDTGRLG